MQGSGVLPPESILVYAHTHACTYMCTYIYVYPHVRLRHPPTPRCDMYLVKGDEAVVIAEQRVQVTGAPALQLPIVHADVLIAQLFGVTVGVGCLG